MTFPRVPVVKTPDWERRAGGALNDALERIDAIQTVVGPQQATIADDASGAANEATVNAILAALRAHGLIA